jgi:hypothetical protein
MLRSRQPHHASPTCSDFILSLSKDEVLSVIARIHPAIIREIFLPSAKCTFWLERFPASALCRLWNLRFAAGKKWGIWRPKPTDSARRAAPSVSRARARDLALRAHRFAMSPNPSD